MINISKQLSTVLTRDWHQAKAKEQSSINKGLPKKRLTLHSRFLILKLLVLSYKSDGHVYYQLGTGHL
jgi:hypothetical protein